MWKCPNCSAQHSCGCKRQTATDGTKGCVKCVPKINASVLTSPPSKVAKAIYKGPGQQIPTALDNH